MAKTKDTYRLSRPPEVVDLFCGAGGLTHGFVLEGLPVTAGIDLADYRADGVMFLSGVGALTSGDAAVLQAEHSDDGSTYSNIGDPAQTVAAQTDVAVDVLSNGKRYVRATLVRTGPSVECNGIYAFIYRTGKLPVTQPATTIAKQVVNP